MKTVFKLELDIILEHDSPYSFQEIKEDCKRRVLGWSILGINSLYPKKTSFKLTRKSN